MCALGNLADEVWLSNSMLNAEAVNYTTSVLFGVANIATPAREICRLYLRRRSTQEAIHMKMPTFNANGLEGDEFLLEDGEESAAAKDDGAGVNEES